MKHRLGDLSLKVNAFVIERPCALPPADRAGSRAARMFRVTFTHGGSPFVRLFWRTRILSIPPGNRHPLIFNDSRDVAGRYEWKIS